MRIFRSFKCAFDGIVYCINNERHMRIHTAVALYLIAFLPFFHLSKVGYAVMLLTISLVISMEMINTSVEELTNLSSSSYNPLAKVAKDIAAGAVLVSSIFAVIIGVVLLWNINSFIEIFYFLIDPIWHLILWIIVTIIVAIYVILGPRGIHEKWLITKTKKQK